MKAFIRLIVPAIALMFVSSFSYGQAEGDKTVQDKGKAVDRKQERKPKGEPTFQEKSDAIVANVYTTPVYMFCISAEFGDSTVYFTSVQEVDSVQLTKKYDLLRYRSYYSGQFNDYLSTAFAAQKQTTSVFFDKKRSRAIKRFNKVLKKYEAAKGSHVIIVTEDKFQLRSAEDLSNVVM